MYYSIRPKSEPKKFELYAGIRYNNIGSRLLLVCGSSFFTVKGSNFGNIRILWCTVANPTYKQVCTGHTGHAEVCQIVYDPGQITFAEILTVFWSSHDPTTLNQQGADFGTQYRSVIFYHTEEQKKIATDFRKKLDESHIYDGPVVTAIEKYPVFYLAETDHQDYYANNMSDQYCTLVIQPKVNKVRELFSDMVK